MSFSQDALDFAEAFLASDLLPASRIRAVVGSDVVYGEELLDLYALLPVAERGRLMPLLDEAHYRRQRPDLPAGENALADFFLAGLPAGIDPHPLVSFDYMRFIRPDMMKPQNMTPAFFWSLFARNLVAPGPFFDLGHYGKSMKGPAASPSLLFDFLLRGDEAGCSPHPLVDIGRYQASYSDAPGDRRQAFLHFICIGDAEARKAGPGFDPAWYRTHYAENGHPIERPLHHFLRYGRFAGRAPRAGQVSAGGDSGQMAAAAGVVQVFEPDRSPGTILSNHAELSRHIQAGVRARAERFVETDIRPVIAEDPEALLGALRFEVHGAPEIDVLIPCYDEFGKTVECLASIAQATPSVPLNVTLIDDCSPDPRMARFAEVPGLTYVRNHENLHFLRSCNAAYRAGRAPYVLLLNNDAQIVGNAIDELWSEMQEDPGIAAAAPMILYPNGRLQEAGCCIEADGDTSMVGVGDEPDLPKYRRSRDIPYGSGACLLMRRERVGEDLFDERFAPAYCEDVDLCLRLRQEGGRIRYVGRARCVHHLSASTSAMSERRRVQLVRRNQQKILEKWGERLTDGLAVRVLAFYLPQFHPVRENDLWWGKGFTEWTNVAKAQPSYAQHYQPHLPTDLGFYDLRLIETMEEQMALARRYGIHGFVMYYYNFGGRRVLSRPLENLIARGDADFRFCLCWANENWTRHWDGGSQKHALMSQDYEPSTYESFADDAIAAARLPGAITVNGYPLLLIYRPLLVPDVAEVCAYLRRRFREAGFDGLYLAYVESMETAAEGVDPAALGFDASVEFPPQGVAEPLKRKVTPLKSGFMGKLYDYAGTVVNASRRGQPGYTRFPGVAPSWDNTPRQPLAHTTLEGALPERFQAYVEAKLQDAHEFLHGDERLLFVNAWNEWAEGAHLEPDRMFEHDWLRALGDALDARQFRDWR